METIFLGIFLASAAPVKNKWLQPFPVAAIAVVTREGGQEPDAGIFNFSCKGKAGGEGGKRFRFWKPLTMPANPFPTLREARNETVIMEYKRVFFSIKSIDQTRSARRKR